MRAFLLPSTLLMFVASGVPALGAEPIPVKSIVISLIDHVNVPSRQAGVIEELRIREGDAVEQGQMLARLDSRDAELQCDRHRASLEIAKVEAANEFSVQLAEKSLAVAAAELDRAEQSNKKYDNSVSDTELDKLRFVRDQSQLQIEDAKHDVELAALQVTLRKAELAVAENLLAQRSITSPLTGVVVQVQRQRGEWIQPGETLCRIIRTDRVRAEGFVNISSPTVTTGQPVELTWTSGNGTVHRLQGHLTFIHPEVNPITGEYRVWAEIENPERILRPGHRPAMVILPSEEATTTSSLP